MPSLRTKSVSTKVTDEEYAQFEALAGEQTLSEWARDVLLRATKPNAGEQTVLAEILALRTILLNIHFAISQGQTLTVEEMQQLIEQADPEQVEQGATAPCGSSNRKCAMKQRWGREDDAGEFPSDKAVWTIGAFCVALLSVFAIGYYRYLRVWTPLQQRYLTAYVGTPVAGAFRTDGWYTLLMAVTRKGTRMALDNEVEALRHRERRGHVYADRRGHQGR